jgi:hypothetical protein
VEDGPSSHGHVTGDAGHTQPLVTALGAKNHEASDRPEGRAINHAAANAARCDWAIGLSWRGVEKGKRGEADLSVSVKA